VPSRVAGTSALSFMKPFSVTPCATEHDGAFKFLAVTGTDSLFSVRSCYVQCHHLSHSTQSNNMGRSSRGQSLGSTIQSQSQLPEEQPHKNHSLAPLPPLLAVTGIDSPWTEVAT